MEYLISGAMGIAIGYFFTKTEDNKKITELEDENYELQKWKDNHSDAERRATTFAKKLKKIEDIIIEDMEKGEFDPITLGKIKKELLITR